jgi:hypothetical protein
MNPGADLARAALKEPAEGVGLHFHDDQADDTNLSDLVRDLYAAGFPAVARRLEKEWAALRLTAAAAARYLAEAQRWNAERPDKLTAPE